SEVVSSALNPGGALTVKMGLEDDEARNLGNVLRWSFTLFRNPVSHPDYALIEYGAAEAQELLGFVNLMLKIMDRGPLPPIKAALRQLQRTLGTPAADRVDSFLKRVQSHKWQIDQLQSGLYFRTGALVTSRDKTMVEPKVRTAFILAAEGDNPRIFVPGADYWRGIPGLNVNGFRKRLMSIGFEEGTGTELDLPLKKHNSAQTFDDLYMAIVDIVRAMEASLYQEGDGR
ncbi:MAG: hypothetical protein GXY76_22390, partial [Chloroflexi bacterium]|nr:hypothetical protein [Chloroflexota bacterium]